MATLKDLNWQQVLEQLPPDSIIIDDTGKAVIDIGAITNKKIDSLLDEGVVKFFNVMFAAANKAQGVANQSLNEEEKLTTFKSAIVGDFVDGFVNLNRSFSCRSELATAANIIGTNG